MLCARVFKLLSLFLLPVFMFPGCMSSFLKTPAVPRRLSASEELDYIISTDRLDSRQNSIRAFLFPRAHKVQLWKERDEARLQRVKEIYLEDSVRSDKDKWNAAIILLHGGSEITRDDTMNYRLAYLLFNDLALNALTPKMKTEGRIWKKIAIGRNEDLAKKYTGNSQKAGTPILPHGR